MSPLLSSITVFNKKLFTFGVPGHLSVGLPPRVPGPLPVGLPPGMPGLLPVGLPPGVPGLLPVGLLSQSARTPTCWYPFWSAVLLPLDFPS